MSVMVLAGILISICGIYLSLSERAAERGQPVNDAESTGPDQPRFVIQRATVFHAVTFVGLAILGLAHASTGELTRASAFASGMRGSVFFLGAGLAIAGAIGVVFASTARTVALSVAMLGFGAAAVLGISGNAIVGGISLAGAAVCGWWLHSQSRPASEANSPNSESTGNDSPISQALNVGQQDIPEPFLTSVAVVMFCCVLGASLQSAVVEETGERSGRNGALRALPRAAYEVDSAQDESVSGVGGQPDVKELASASLSRDDWLFWCAAGLLAATVGLGYLPSDRNHNRACESEADEAVST